MSTVLKDAAVERVKGGRPGRVRAAVAAIVAGAACAALVFKVLRSPSKEPSEELHEA
jgi:hypothetical protein